MADRALLAGYPRIIISYSLHIIQIKMHQDGHWIQTEMTLNLKARQIVCCGVCSWPDPGLEQLSSIDRIGKALPWWQKTFRNEDFSTDVTPRFQSRQGHMMRHCLDGSGFNTSSLMLLSGSGPCNMFPVLKKPCLIVGLTIFSIDH